MNKEDPDSFIMPDGFIAMYHVCRSSFIEVTQNGVMEHEGAVGTASSTTEGKDLCYEIPVAARREPWIVPRGLNKRH